MARQSVRLITNPPIGKIRTNLQQYTIVPKNHTGNQPTIQPSPPLQHQAPSKSSSPIALFRRHNRSQQSMDTMRTVQDTSDNIPPPSAAPSTWVHPLLGKVTKTKSKGPFGSKQRSGSVDGVDAEGGGGNDEGGVGEGGGGALQRRKTLQRHKKMSSVTTEWGLHTDILY
jgi:hypothetical protein